MIKATFFVKGGAYSGFEAKGHAGYARAGSEDIVCAAVSAILLTALNGLMDVIKAPCRVTRLETRGSLPVTLKRAAGDMTRDASLIMAVAKAGIQRVSEDYPGRINLIIKKTED
jgi:uncharacterized protein YsxB (DUF464 family)